MGAASALELTPRGARVTILERGAELAWACSAGNAGIISQVMPSPSLRRQPSTWASAGCSSEETLRRSGRDPQPYPVRQMECQSSADPRPLENLVLATGHGMWGLKLAPFAGRLVSQLVCTEEPSFGVEPYRPDRFRPAFGLAGANA